MKKIVLITGGSGGIGSAVARRVVAAGGTPVLVARDAERLATIAAEIDAPAYPGDVLDSAGFAAIVGRVESEVGPIDGVVHAVGSILLKPLHATSVDDFRATFEINATSAFILMRTVMPLLMRRKRGSVVLFSTVAAATGLPNHESIAAAKSAVEGLVRSAAISYARYGVRVNAVAPALTRTGLSQSLWRNDAMLSASAAMHPLGRIGEPDDIAPAVLYFLSDDSGWTTGQVLGVDGGLGTGTAPPRASAPAPAR
jgi:NAD(P)-dependent dehydrogenase (short-subunit alcohol dehydrogenase family)